MAGAMPPPSSGACMPATRPSPPWPPSPGMHLAPRTSRGRQRCDSINLRASAPSPTPTATCNPALTYPTSSAPWWTAIRARLPRRPESRAQPSDAPSPFPPRSQAPLTRNQAARLPMASRCCTPIPRPESSPSASPRPWPHHSSARPVHRPTRTVPRTPLYPGQMLPIEH